MLALRGRNAAVLPSFTANCTSDGLGTRSARAHRANARAGPINPSADLAGRTTRLGLEVIAKNPRQGFDQPGCQDGLRLTLTLRPLLPLLFVLAVCSGLAAPEDMKSALVTVKVVDASGVSTLSKSQSIYQWRYSILVFKCCTIL